MGDILTALRIGELMFEAELTWQATAALLILFSCGIGVAAWIAAKAVRAWKDALR